MAGGWGGSFFDAVLRGALSGAGLGEFDEVALYGGGAGGVGGDVVEDEAGGDAAFYVEGDGCGDDAEVEGVLGGEGEDDEGTSPSALTSENDGTHACADGSLTLALILDRVNARPSSHDTTQQFE